MVGVMDNAYCATEILAGSSNEQLHAPLSQCSYVCYDGDAKRFFESHGIDETWFATATSSPFVPRSTATSQDATKRSHAEACDASNAEGVCSKEETTRARTDAFARPLAHVSFGLPTFPRSNVSSAAAARRNERTDVLAMHAFHVSWTMLWIQMSSTSDLHIGKQAMNACEKAYEALDAYCTPRWACELFCDGSCVALAGVGSNGCSLLPDFVLDNPDAQSESPLPTCCIDCELADGPGTCEALDAAARCTNRHDCIDASDADTPLVWDPFHFCGNKFGATGSCGCCVASQVYRQEVCAKVEDEDDEEEERSCSRRGGHCTTSDECVGKGKVFLQGLCNKKYPLCGCCLSP